MGILILRMNLKEFGQSRLDRKKFIKKLKWNLMSRHTKKTHLEEFIF